MFLSIKICLIAMKKITKILLVLLILLIIFAGVTTFMQNENLGIFPFSSESATVIGNNSNGTVYKMICGNAMSSDSVVVILGVHSLESGIHNATNETIMNFTKDNSLNKKFIVYFIKLNFDDSGMNTSDYDTNRHMGELLANEYVVPDIDKYHPHVIVDVHEMESYWEKQRYVGVVDNKSSTTMDYANAIGKGVGYPVYTIKSGTSPKWVSEPLAKKGNNVVVFETAQIDSQENKTHTAIDLVRAIDNLPVR